MKKAVLGLWLSLSIQVAAQSASAPSAASNPKVRAITAFVRLDGATYEKQITEALVVLRDAKREFESAGYQVETVRITTQPLAELVAGMTEEQGFGFLTRLDQLSVKEDFLPNVGPAMMSDGDDPATMRLLERALSTLPNIEASTVIAGDDGMNFIKT